MEDVSTLIQGGLADVGPVFVKSLSAMDSGEASTHQGGIYFSNSVARELFGLKCEKRTNEEKKIYIRWVQTGDVYDSWARYYGNGKDEARITRNIYKSGVIQPCDTGSLFVFWREGESDYAALVIKEESDIDFFLEEYGLTPSDLGRIVIGSSPDTFSIDGAIHGYLESIRESGEPFPGSREVSAAARACSGLKKSVIKKDPDGALIKWTDVEYSVFRGLEDLFYGDQIKVPLESIDDFVAVALSITNRRKSRAGHSFENQLEALFDEFGLSFETQVKTEARKRPDFLFPGAAAYFDASFPVEGLTVLAAKTTCKDRWRQVITEADRLRDGWKYLCTLQQGISETQIGEMLADQVRLVCPKKYHSFFSRKIRNELWTIEDFIRHIVVLEESYSPQFGIYY